MRKKIDIMLYFYRLLMILCICLISNICYSQTLSTKMFETATLDLTARTMAVKDANGIECALLKIVSPDIITKVEGNVIKEIDNSNEHWVYLSTGTKQIKIFTLHHSPVTLYFPNFINEGVSSQLTYLLELESDLPIEILYKTMNAFTPIQMSSKENESRPIWWNTTETGLYVGVSCPTFDGESAKLSAICNAINLYAQSIGAKVQYFAEINCSNNSENYKQMYELVLQDFDFKILQEYYSPTGEYFVLCRCSQVKNENNKFAISWVFDDNIGSGDLVCESMFTGKINRSTVDCYIRYNCNWNQNKVKFNAFINGNQILEKEHDLLASHDNLTDMKLSGGIGFNQLRLISSLPCLPDSVSINSGVESERLSDHDNFHAVYQISGGGISVPREYKILDCNDGTCSFVITENFPAAKSFETQIPTEELDKTGLSVKYFRDYGDMAVSSFGRTDKSIALEHNKNVVFLNGICTLQQTISQQSKDGNQNTIVQQYTINENPNTPITQMKSTSANKVAIYPLWYLDPTERRKYQNKKNKSNWEDSQLNLESQVCIVSPRINMTHKLNK